MINGIKEFAALQISRGYQKDTTKEQQRYSSVYAVMHTLLEEYEKEVDQPLAVIDFRGARGVMYEKETVDRRK